MKYTIFDNYDATEAYETAKQGLIDNEVESPTDEQIWDFAGEIENEWWEDALEILTDLFGDNRVIVKGTYSSRYFGGTHELIQQFDGQERAMQVIIKDCDYIKIEVDDDLKEAYITATHHDGTNSVTMKILTEWGYDKYNDWVYEGFLENLNEYQILDAIWNNEL